MAGISAQYVNDYTLTVSGTSIVNECHYGRRLICDCGINGEKGITISGSSYSDPLTTVNTYASDSGALTSNLVSFKYGVGVSADKYGSVSPRGIDHDKLSGVDADNHHAESHTVVSHSDTTATGAELETLTDNSIADTLHRHSELVASDGSPDPVISCDADGKVTINSATYLILQRTGTDVCWMDHLGFGTYSGKYFVTGEVRAQSSPGLLLRDDSGTLGITVADGGKVSLANGTGINEFSTDTTLAGDSDDAVPTEKATKTYIDARGNTSLVDNSIANTLHRHSELVASDGSPDPALSIGADGGLSTNGPNLEINSLGSGNRYTYIDLVGDDTYTDYGLRIIRSNTGANATSQIQHRGTGGFTIKTQEASAITLKTANTTRLTIDSNGDVQIGTGTATERFEVYPDTDVSAVIGKAHIGYVGYGDWAGFSHVDQNGTTTYCLMHGPAGGTYLNAATGKVIYLQNNHTTIAYVHSGGITFTAGKFIYTDEVRALGSGGLSLKDDSGTLGVFIKDGGDVGIGTSPGAGIELDVSGDIHCSGKLSSDGGNDPPYVLYNNETRQSIIDRVKIEVPTNKLNGAVMFYNGDTNKMELYHPNTGIFTDITGEQQLITVAPITETYGSKLKYYLDKNTGEIKTIEIRAESKDYNFAEGCEVDSDTGKLYKNNTYETDGENYKKGDDYKVEITKEEAIKKVKE